MTEPDSPNAFRKDMAPTNARTHAEAEVEELRLRGGAFVEAVRATRMAMVLTDPSLPGNPIVFANPSFLTLSGYEMDEVLGQQPYFLNGPDTDPQDAKRFRNALKDDHDETLQTIQYAKDGTRMVVSLFLTALKDDDGRTLHHLLSWRDITRQVDAESEAAALREAREQIRQSEEKYRRLFETMGQGYALVELVRDEGGRAVDQRYLEFNPASERLLGISAGDAAGKLASEVFPDLEPEWTETFDRVVRTLTPERIEHPVTPLDRWFEVYAYPAGADRFIALYEDITERKRAQAQLSEREQRQSFLLKLSDALRAEPSAEAVANKALRMLLEELDLDRCYVGIYRLEEDVGEFPHEVHDAGLPSLPRQVRLSDFPKALEIAFERTLVIDDVVEMQSLSGNDQASFTSLGMRALISATLRKGEQHPVWAINAISSRPRAWTLNEISLVEEVAERTWAAVERARAEEALSGSEERLRLIVENARDYAIFTSDKDDVIDNWMPGAEAVFGYTRKEAEGQPSAIIFTPGDRVQGQPEKEIETAVREGKAANVRWHIRKDGELVFIEGQVVPLHGPTGELRGFLKIGQDVTERRLAEQALHESEARFRQFGEASSDLLWIRDAETLAFEYVSPAFERLYGVPREHILQANDVKAWAELIHPDDREGALDVLRNLREGVPGAYEFRVVRPEGRVCWLHDTNFPLRDDSGRVVRIAGIAQDVSERRRAVELQATLLAELQHRVRNILAMIQSVVRRTMDTSDSPEEYARHLGGRIAAMARTQVMLTRSTTRRVSLEELVRDELLSVAASDKQHWCEGPKVLLFPKAAEVFTLAIHELATNSVKYGALSTSRGHLEIRWSLEDRGEQQWLIFEWEENRVQQGGFSREGFGTELITRRVPYELRGRGTMQPTDEGMIARLEFPLVPSNSILETYAPERPQ